MADCAGPARKVDGKPRDYPNPPKKKEKRKKKGEPRWVDAMRCVAKGKPDLEECLLVDQPAAVAVKVLYSRQMGPGRGGTRAPVLR